jgi:hypothetical protein
MTSPLPDTSSWQPRLPRNGTSIAEALSARCKAAEEAICLRARAESQLSVDAFDSGLAVEDLVRETLRSLLPARYQVTAGSVVDSSGHTAGDVDVVVFNSHWFPEVLAPATATTRRKLLPYEGVYAVGEIKQTLTKKSLDDALEKLVGCHRLKRTSASRKRLTENREFEPCSHGLSNPLYSFVVGVSADDDIQGLIERFVNINKSLKRLEVVRALCVLGRGTVVWATHNSNEVKSALFMAEDLSLPIVPAYFPTPDSGPSLYTLLENLLLHLYHSILAPEDIAARYGPLTRGVKIPTNAFAALLPDSKD